MVELIVRGMIGSFRFVVVGWLVLCASAVVEQRALADGVCVRRSDCPEERIDARGCCMLPAATAGSLTSPLRERPPASSSAGAKRGAGKSTQPGKSAAGAPGAPDGSDAATIGVLIQPPPSGRAHCPARMVNIPGATFWMGSRPGEGGTDEQRHQVALAGYCLDRTEVTVAEYAQCVAAGKCTAAPEPGRDGFASLCNGTRADRQNHPINCIDWSQAAAYCASVHKRLASEAEWEYAARGREEFRFPWGNEDPAPGRLNACGSECRALSKRFGREWSAMYDDDDRWEATAPVASFPAGASPFGAFDMPGNVAEWTADLYASYDGTASQFSDGPHRVVRGGAWTQADPSGVRGASRLHAHPASRRVDLGLRCARGSEPFRYPLLGAVHHLLGVPDGDGRAPGAP